MKDKDEDFLCEVRELFDRASDAYGDNHRWFEEDLRFVNGEQWDDEVSKLRSEAGRPCITINKLPTFIRQVVNDARQNKPSITVHPSDSSADPETAEILSGLIRNIEVQSDADIAYDTAIYNSVAGGFGYIRVNIKPAGDDTFDSDVVIERVADPLTVFPDPDATSADGSDWNHCFIVSTMTEDEFEDKYGEDGKVDWEGYRDLSPAWKDGEHVTVAEYWKREDVEREIIALSNDTVMSLDDFEEQAEELIALGIVPVSKPRKVMSQKVTQYVLSGAEVLDTVEWQGRYIPIIPVYGDEINIGGERIFKSLIRDAKDVQREFNYWRSTAAELVALSPKSPFVGPKGAFDTDVEKWSAINDSSIPFVEFDGPTRPTREQYVGPPAAVIQQALASADDMKAVIGLYDASLGQRSNETSGIAINARKREGDVSTFHFIDNLTRSIRQTGRVLIDLIPQVYSTARVIRVLGKDMQPANVQVAPQEQQQQVKQRAMERGQQIARIFDLSAGKYDLTVKSGPGYTTARELAQAELVEIIRAIPSSSQILLPMYLRNADWPGAEEAAKALEGPMQQQQGVPPQIQQQLQQMQQAIQQGQQQLNALAEENKALKLDVQNRSFELQIKDKEANAKTMDAETRRIQAEADAMRASAERTNLYSVAAPSQFGSAA